MRPVDWIALAVIALAALGGLRRGLVAGVFSLAGFVAGAWIGSRIAPELLPERHAVWIPVATLVGAVTGGLLAQSVARMAGGAVRATLLALPPLRALDSAGGLVLGAAIGLALCWVVAAVALYLPGQTDARRYVQESSILSAINERVPPERLIDTIARVDPFGALSGPSVILERPDGAILRSAAVDAARSSVVRITGVACGLGVEGSGWIAAPGLVVTNAHVVAGVDEPRVDRSDRRYRSATVVAFDRVNDVAVLRVRGLSGSPLQLAEPEGRSGLALLGFPQNGPFRATALRYGTTRSVISRDAYGRFPTRREIVTLRGDIRPGNSGGPAVDAAGRVAAVVFAASTGSDGGYGIPTTIVRQTLDNAGTKPLRTACTG